MPRVKIIDMTEGIDIVQGFLSIDTEAILPPPKESQVIKEQLPKSATPHLRNCLHV